MAHGVGGTAVLLCNVRISGRYIVSIYSKYIKVHSNALGEK